MFLLNYNKAPRGLNNRLCTLLETCVIHSFSPPGNCNLLQHALDGTVAQNDLYSSEQLLTGWLSLRACMCLLIKLTCISNKYVDRSHKNRRNLPWEALNRFCSSVLQYWQMMNYVQHVAAHCETLGGLN